MNTASKKEELRKTGISVIGDLPWGTHFCYFYETKEDLLETQVPYFKAGLEGREFCVWVVSPVLQVEEAKSALQKAVPDLERHLAEGALEIHTHDQWYLRDGQCDPLRVLQSWREKIIQTSAKGYAGLRAAGDGGWIGSDEWMAFCEYEKQVSEMVADERSIILCTYPLTTSPGDQVFDVAHIHRVAVARRNGSWEMIETPELKEAKGEIKRLNEELERKVEERTRELAATNEALKSEIAERALAEAAVRQSESHIRLVIDTIPTMAWTLRPDGVVDFVNQRWIEYTGLSLEEALEDSKSIVHPEDLPKAVEKWHPNMAAGNPHEDETRLRRADGEYRWFLIRIVPLRDEQGNIVKWYGASSDIEDRKQAEMVSWTLIDAIPHQIWSGPADGTLDYCNEQWRSYMGLELEDLCGDGWQSMLHPDDRARVLQAWRESVLSGKPYEQEERHKGADGTYRWFLALGVPLRDAEGRIVRWYGTNTDIEDRKRAEEALRKSEKLFAVFMDQLPGFAWMKDVEGRYVWVNKKEAELDAYHDGVIGKTDADLWPEEIASAYRANDDKVIATKKAVQTVEPSLARGDRSYMLVTKFPIFDQDGSVVIVAGAGVDITDLTQARDALNAQALRYKTLMATSTDSIYILDQNGDLQEANAAFLRRRGYTPAEVKGLNVADWDAQWNREEIRERIQDVLESSAMFETRHRCKDGSIFDVEVCATGVQIAGEQLFFCVTRDISERKQAEDRLRRSEEKFKTLFGLAPVGISVVDQQHNVVDANPALEQIVRLSRKELMSRKHPHRVILSADGKPKLLHEFPSQRAIKENRAIHDEMAIVAENGEIIWVQVSAAPLALPDASAVVITQDITERKRAAKELEEANQQLRTLSRQLFHVQEEERRHLARELHDEIGQNLTAAKINLNIIAPNVPADATRRLEDSIQLLDGLLGQVRQLSLDLRPPLLDELGLVPTLRWLVDQQAQRAGLRGSFTANVDGAEIDPDTRTACFRVAQEAITNIIRHAGAKNVALEVLCDAERLTLSVRDDGAGFNPIAIQQRTTRDFTLGLVSMRERTSLMRGGFEVHSAPGQGTEIRAWFPLAPGKPPSTETA